MTQTECQKALADANDAYHRLITGQAARVIVDSNGQRVEFAAGNRADLYAYIQRLNAMCPAPCAGSLPAPRGPIGFVF